MAVFVFIGGTGNDCFFFWTIHKRSDLYDLVRFKDFSSLMILVLFLFFAVVIAIFTLLFSYLVRNTSDIKQDNYLMI